MLILFFYFVFAPIVSFGLLDPTTWVLPLPICLGVSPIPDATFGGLPHPRFSAESGEG